MKSPEDSVKSNDNGLPKFAEHAMPQKRSIKDYTEELREHGQQAVESEDDSSSYVIDYEQVLKDNPMPSTDHFRSKSDYRDDDRQNTILEQTQEA